MYLSFFYCYDKKLARWLLDENELKYNCTGYHTKSSDQFWQFTKSDELQKALDQFNEMYRKHTSKVL
jgi:hypothetical protein